MSRYTLYVFSMNHPQVEGASKVSIIAESRPAAIKALEEEFFFNQSTLNGFLFDLVDLYSVELPSTYSPSNGSSITVEDEKGNLWTRGS